MKTKLLENHICAFNDGEQSCECYKKACEDIIKLMKEEMLRQNRNGSNIITDRELKETIKQIKEM